MSLKKMTTLLFETFLKNWNNTAINTIIKEYVRGYQMGSRVIRPSKVKVTKKKSLESKEAQSETKSTEKTNQKEG